MKTYIIIIEIYTPSSSLLYPRSFFFSNKTIKIRIAFLDIRKTTAFRATTNEHLKHHKMSI